MIKKQLKRLIPSSIKRRIKLLTNKSFKVEEFEKERLKNWPRYTETTVTFLGRELKVVDIASYFFLKKELFDLGIYKFNCLSANPYIIDCGANIGLSVIYFKNLFPNAEIVAFEPDNKVFDVLKKNVETFNLSDVSLLRKACWNEETTLKFYSEGADGGRAAVMTDTENIIEVETIRLKPFLNKKVDFLKIDIEGAEIDVLEDCKELLINVDNLFVEYHSFVGVDQRLDRLLTILKFAGFRYLIQQHGVVSANPFLKVENQSGMDILLNISAFRKLN